MSNHLLQRAMDQMAKEAMEANAAGRATLGQKVLLSSVLYGRMQLLRATAAVTGQGLTLALLMAVLEHVGVPESLGEDLARRIKAGMDVMEGLAEAEKKAEAGDVDPEVLMGVIESLSHAADTIAGKPDNAASN